MNFYQQKYKHDRASKDNKLCLYARRRIVIDYPRAGTHYRPIWNPLQPAWSMPFRHRNLPWSELILIVTYIGTMFDFCIGLGVSVVPQFEFWFRSTSARCRPLGNLFASSRVYSVLNFYRKMTTPSGAICAVAEGKMRMFLIMATVATVTLATLIPGLSLTKALSSPDFTTPPSAVRVAGGVARVRDEPPPSVPACWDDKSGQLHCHV